jgi:hypothetical protein
MRLKFGRLGAQFWAGSFLRNLRREMRPIVDDPAAIDREIRGQAQALFDGRVDTLPDKQARVILAMCSLVLASYRVLLAHTRQADAAFDTVRRAFARTGLGPLTWLVRAWLWLHRDPVAALQGTSFESWGRRMYGKSMQFAEDKSQDKVAFLVTRCAFHQFFTDHGHPELTPLVCAWDRAWMDAIDRSRRPVRTERPSTISTGGECCRFSFVRDAEKTDKDRNDVVLVQLQSRVPGAAG